MFQGVSCGASANSAVTHTSSVNKTAPVSLVWTPPSPADDGNSGGQVIFVATVVQSFDTYWVGIYSDAVNLPTATSGATAAARALSPSSAMTGSAGVTPTTANSAFANGAASISNMIRKEIFNDGTT